MSECYVEGTVEIRNLNELLEKHNRLLEEQNQILSNISINLRDVLEAW